MCAAPSRVMDIYATRTGFTLFVSFFCTIAAPDMTFIFRDLWHILSLPKGLLTKWDVLVKYDIRNESQLLIIGISIQGINSFSTENLNKIADSFSNTNKLSIKHVSLHSNQCLLFSKGSGWLPTLPEIMFLCVRTFIGNVIWSKSLEIRKDWFTNKNV